MSLIDVLGSGKKAKVVNVEDLRTNDYNFYPFEEEVIDRLAKSIDENGQLENATVYEEDLDDGHQYTLLGGESRFRAICKLVEEGKSNGEINVVVVDKPQDTTKEKMLIMEDNIQRHKSKQTLIKEIEVWEKIYDELVESGNAPTGRKRDFIGKNLGLSGRTIENLKSQNEPRESQETREPNREDVTKKIKTMYNASKKLKELAEVVDDDRISDIVNIVNSLEELL